MFENRMYRICREADLLKAADTLPELSPGLRSRVLAAAIEAQDRRAQGRRVLASALGLFAMLAGVAWLGPFSNNPFSDASNIASDSAISGSSTNALVAREELADVGVAVDRAAGDKAAGEKISDKKAASVLSSFSRGQGLMSMMGDDWRSVEDELRSRQEHFPRFQM